MTVPSEVNRSGPYNGNGVTTVFGYGFRIVDQGHLDVIKTSALGTDTTLTITTDYTVSGVGNPAGGSIACVVPPTSGETITILRSVPFTQETDLENQGAYYAETVEDALDLAAMRDQQMLERVERSVQIPASYTGGASLILPTPERDKFLAWNEEATALRNADASELVTIAAYGTANADIFTGDGVTTEFALSASPGVINNLDVAIGGVTQLPGVDYTWVSGTKLTFASPPANGLKILARYMQGLAQGSSRDDLVVSDDGVGGALWGNVKEFISYLRSSIGSSIIGFIQAGVGAVWRPAQDKMREIASVKDFGAKGDGSDDTAALQKAFDAILSANLRGLYFPPGTYGISGTLTLPVALSSFQIIGGSGYDGVRGPINYGLATSIKWIGATDATKPMVKFNQSSGVLWRGVTVNCDGKAGYGLQFMSSDSATGSVKNVVENCSIHYAARDGIIVGSEGTPSAPPAGRQFFGNVFRNLTFFGCRRSAIHINEWNADQQMFDSVMVYADDRPSPWPCDNAFWFAYGGQWSILVNCQVGGMTVDPSDITTGWMIRNGAYHATDPVTTAGAFGLTVVNCWQEGAGGIYLGVTSTNDQKGFNFVGCASFTSGTGPSMLIDKGTSSPIKYNISGCSFSSDVKLANPASGKDELTLTSCTFAAGKGVVDSNGRRTVAGVFIQGNTSGGVIVVPRFSKVYFCTLVSNIASVAAEGVGFAGDQITMIVTQDATGGRTITWSGGSMSTLPLPPQPATAPGAKTVYTFVSDGTAYSLVSAVS